MVLKECLRCFSLKRIAKVVFKMFRTLITEISLPTLYASTSLGSALLQNKKMNFKLQMQILILTFFKAHMQILILTFFKAHMQTSNANLNLNIFQSATLQPTCWPRTLCRSSSQTAAKSPDSNPPTANFHLRRQFQKSRKIASRLSLTGDSLIFLPGCPPFIPPPKPPPP